MLRNPKVRNVLYALAVAAIGFVLLHVAFILDWLFQSFLDVCLRPFVSANVNRDWPWYPPLKHGLFLLLLASVSWLVFRSRLGTLYKAAYLTVPTAAALVTVGMALYRTPAVSFVIGLVLTLGVLFRFYRTRQPWLYHYAVVLVALALLIGGLLGMDI